MILAMEVNANSYQTSSSPSNNVMKYHIGSSLVNPITLSDIRHLSFQYFTKNPICTKNGKLVKVSKFTFFKSMPTFNMYMAIRFMLPLKVCFNKFLFPRFYSKNYTKKRRFNCTYIAYSFYILNFIFIPSIGTYMIFFM